jgi:hypothetical protein
MIKVLILLLALVATVKCFECLSCPEESIQCAADTCDDGVTCTRIESSCFACQELFCGREWVDCPFDPDPCSTANCDGDCTIIPQTVRKCASAYCEPVACVNCSITPQQSCHDLGCWGDGTTCKVTGDPCLTCQEATCVEKSFTCLSCLVPKEEVCNDNLCATGETCVVIDGKCDMCPEAICLPEFIPGPCVSCSLPEEETCDNENLCATGETCEYTGGDCDTCPKAICVAEPTIECDEDDECQVQASCDKVHCAYGSSCKVTPQSCNGCSSAICVVDGCFTPKKSYFEDADAQSLKSSGHSGQMGKSLALVAVTLVVVAVVV